MILHSENEWMNEIPPENIRLLSVFWCVSVSGLLGAVLVVESDSCRKVAIRNYCFAALNCSQFWKPNLKSLNKFPSNLQRRKYQVVFSFLVLTLTNCVLQVWIHGDASICSELLTFQIVCPLCVCQMDTWPAVKFVNTGRHHLIHLGWHCVLATLYHCVTVLQDIIWYSFISPAVGKFAVYSSKGDSAKNKMHQLTQ